jgi:hypothetical protein
MRLHRCVEGLPCVYSVSVIDRNLGDLVRYFAFHRNGRDAVKSEALTVVKCPGWSSGFNAVCT